MGCGGALGNAAKACFGMWWLAQEYCFLPGDVWWLIRVYGGLLRDVVACSNTADMVAQWGCGNFLEDFLAFLQWLIVRCDALM